MEYIIKLDEEQHNVHLKGRDNLFRKYNPSLTTEIPDTQLRKDIKFQ